MIGFSILAIATTLFTDNIHLSEQNAISNVWIHVKGEAAQGLFDKALKDSKEDVYSVNSKKILNRTAKNIVCSKTIESESSDKADFGCTVSSASMHIEANARFLVLDQPSNTSSQHLDFTVQKPSDIKQGSVVLELNDASAINGVTIDGDFAQQLYSKTLKSAVETGTSGDKKDSKVSVKEKDGIKCFKQTLRNDGQATATNFFCKLDGVKNVQLELAFDDLELKGDELIGKVVLAKAAAQKALENPEQPAKK